MDFLTAAHAYATARARAASEAHRSALRLEPSGAVSLAGQDGSTVTLYPARWNAILAMADEIRSFLAANDSPRRSLRRDWLGIEFDGCELDDAVPF